MRGNYGSGVWQEIRKEWEAFLPDTFCSLGNGRRVRFWKDKWCGEEPLSLTFPSLFSIATNKEAMVADYWNPIGEEGGWSPLFARPFIDWEMEDVKIFQHDLQGKRVILDQEDVLLLMKNVRMRGFR